MVDRYPVTDPSETNKKLLLLLLLLLQRQPQVSDPF